MSRLLTGWGLPQLAALGAGAFSPLSLSPALWLRADAGTYQSADTTTPAVDDGDPVRLWVDQSGNGRNVSQATSSKRPALFNAIQNGLPVVRSDGVDDRLQGLFTLDQPYSLFAVARYRSARVGNDTLLDGGSNNSGRLYRASDGMRVYAGVAGTIVAAVDLEQWHIYAAVFNGIASALSVDAGADSTGDPGPNNPGGLTLADSGSAGGEPAPVDIAEVVYLTGTVSAGNKALLLAYLNTRWGVY